MNPSRHPASRMSVLPPRPPSQQSRDEFPSSSSASSSSLAQPDTSKRSSKTPHLNGGGAGNANGNLISVDDHTTALAASLKVVLENTKRLTQLQDAVAQDDSTETGDRSQLTSLDKELEPRDLYSLVEQLRKEAAVREQITQVQEKTVASLMDQYKALDQQRLEQETMIRDRDASIERLTRKVQDIEASARRREEEIRQRAAAATFDQSKQLGWQLEAARRKSHELEELVVAKGEEIERLHVIVEEKLAEAIVAAGKLVTAERRAEDLERGLKRKEEDLARLTNTTFSGTSSISGAAAADDRQQRLREDAYLAELQSQLDASQRTIRELQQGYTRAERQLQERADEVTTLQGKIVTATEVAGDLEARVTRQNKEIVTLKGEISRYKEASKARDHETRMSAHLQQELDWTRQQLREQTALVKAKDGMIEKVEKEMEMSRKDLISKEDENMLNALIEAHEKTIDSLREDLDRAENKRDELKEKIRDKDDQVKMMESQVARWKEDGEKAIKEKEEMMKSLEREVVRWKEEAQKFGGRAAVENTNSNPAKFKDMYATYDTRIKQLEEALEREAEQRQQEVKEKEEEIKRMQRLSDEQAKRSTELLQQVVRLELDTRRTPVESSMEENSKEKDAAAVATKRLERKLRDTQKQLEAKSAQLTEQADMMTRNQEHMTILTQQLKEYRKTIKERDVRITQLVQNVKELREETTRLQRSGEDGLRETMRSMMKNDEELDQTLFRSSMGPETTAAKVFPTPTVSSSVTLNFGRASPTKQIGNPNFGRASVGSGAGSQLDRLRKQRSGLFDGTAIAAATAGPSTSGHGHRNSIDTQRIPNDVYRNSSDANRSEFGELNFGQSNPFTSSGNTFATSSSLASTVPRKSIDLTGSKLPSPGTVTASVVSGRRSVGPGEKENLKKSVGPSDRDNLRKSIGPSDNMRKSIGPSDRDNLRRSIGSNDGDTILRRPKIGGITSMTSSTSSEKMAGGGMVNRFGFYGRTSQGSAGVGPRERETEAAV